MFRLHVVLAIFSRNFKQYFTSVLGYLFIFVFVTMCAILTFSARFFVDNQANLDQLSSWFPVLLLFLIPAITMPVWADEKRQGTDAILFTLPASDLEILLGKFFSVVAVYTVALLFSFTQLVALGTLGSPDWGIIATTYLGYWLAGLAMLAIGMFASSLTASNTVAFVIGALLCTAPVIIGYDFIAPRLLQPYSVSHQLQDFTMGLVSLPGVVYFLSIVAFMLYLNLVVIGQRHWNRGQGRAMSVHFLVRTTALAAALIAGNVICERSAATFPTRLDLTADRLYTLDPTTRQTIAEAAANNRPVTIEAYISPDVPQQFVSARKRLIGLLRQYDRLGGSNLEFRLVEVKPNSDQINEAQSHGIVPRLERDDVAGKVVEQDVFMGVRVTSTLDEVVLPFVDGEHSIEYQLTRALASTTRESRKLVVGILKTDAHFNNFKLEGQLYDWMAPRVVNRLSSQFDLVDVEPARLAEWLPDREGDDSIAEARGAAAADADDRPDVLVVVDPSSLPLNDLFTLIAWVDAGNPTMILADPLPFYWFTYRAPEDLGIVNAPAQPRIGPQSVWARYQVPTSSEPKALDGKLTPLLEKLGITWKHDRTVWSVDNPHLTYKPVVAPIFGERWPERYGPRNAALVFARNTPGFQVFSPEHAVSGGLQEILFVYPGSLAPVADADTTFQPLVTLKPGTAGHYEWDELTEEPVTTRQEMNRMTGAIEEITAPEINRFTGNNLRLLRPVPRLSRDRGEPEGQPTSSRDEGSAKDDPSGSAITADTPVRTRLDPQAHVLAAHIRGSGDHPLNVIFVADADFASDMFVEQEPALDTPLDNLTFLANAIESLAGDETFVRLRNRRARPRNLTAIESATEPFRIQAAMEQDKVEADMDRKLADAEAAIRAATERIQNNQDMSVWQKIQEAGLSLASENRKLERQREKLVRQREKSMDEIATRRQQ